MLQKLQETFKPVGHCFADIPRTFTPYRLNHPDFALEAFNSQEFRDDNLWGDVAQPVRGIVNMAKGVGRLLLFVFSIIPVTFPLVALGRLLWERRQAKKRGESFGYDKDNEEFRGPVTFKMAAWTVFKEIPYNLINGIGILLRGALQLVTTPLTWFIRIPLRRAITAGVNNPEYTAEYNRKTANNYIVSTQSPFQRIKGDFNGTLAAYDKENLFWNVIADFFQPFRGLWNIAKGAVLAPLAVLRFILGTILPFEFLVRCVFMKQSAKVVFFGEEDGKDYNAVWPMLKDSIGVLMRGILQVVTTPLEWFIRMPLRGLITYHMGDNYGRPIKMKGGNYRRENKAEFSDDEDKDENEQQEYGRNTRKTKFKERNDFEGDRYSNSGATAYPVPASYPTSGGSYGFTVGRATGRGSSVISQSDPYYGYSGDDSSRGRSTNTTETYTRIPTPSPTRNSDSDSE